MILEGYWWCASKSGSDLQNHQKSRALCSDVYQNQFGHVLSSNVEMKITVQRILNRYSNRFRSKERSIVRYFCFDRGLKNFRMVKNAEDFVRCYTEQASILKNKSDLSTEMIQVNLKAVWMCLILGCQACSEKMWFELPVFYESKMKNMYRFLASEAPGSLSIFKSMKVRKLIILAGTSRNQPIRKISRSQEDLEDTDLGTLSTLFRTSGS